MSQVFLSFASLCLLTFFSAFFLAISMALSLRLNSLLYCVGRMKEREWGIKEVGEKRKRKREHFNRLIIGRRSSLFERIAPSNCPLRSTRVLSGPQQHTSNSTRQAAHVKQHTQQKRTDRKRKYKRFESVCFSCTRRRRRRRLPNNHPKKTKTTHVLLIFSPFSSTVSSVHFSGRT